MSWDEYQDTIDALRAERDALQARVKELESLFQRTHRVHADWVARGDRAESTLKAEQTAHAATRVEVERLKAALSAWVEAKNQDVKEGVYYHLHNVKLMDASHAALDSSTPAPRMFTEEQVREAWAASHPGADEFDVLDLDELLKELLDPS